MTRRLVRKIARRARRLLRTGPRWDEARALAEERRKFDAVGLDYDAAVERLDRLLASLDAGPYVEALGGMPSIHWVLFCALAAHLKPQRILEIGTYDGETTRLLAALFPDAHLTTVDLPHDDPRFAGTYKRQDDDKRRAFIERQRANTSAPNVELLLLDSFLLPERVAPGFDLIWVDGGHLYPVVAWDVCNAYHLCAPGGWILCDDILDHPRPGGGTGVGPEAFEVTEYLKAWAPVEVNYFLKRHVASFSADPRRRKYVATVRKRG